MRRRILAAILSVTGIAIVLFGAPLAVIVEHLDDDAALLRLERQTVQAARRIPSGSTLGDAAAVLPAMPDQTSLALYGPTGERVSGTGPVHGDRVVRRALDDEVADFETDRQQVVAVPIGSDTHTVGVLRAEQPTRASNLRTLRVVGLFAGLGIGVLGLGALIAFWVADRLTHPVRRLRDAAVGLGDGDFTTQMPQSRVPELQELADALSSTARRLDELLARERSFSTDASHQLRTPLAGLRASIETELAFPRDDPTEVLAEALVDIDRLSQTITELLVLARGHRDVAGSVNVDDVLADLRARWTPRFAAAGRRLDVTEARGLPAVIGQSAPLRHTLDVLVENALVHGAGSTALTHQLGDGTVTISVTDEGPGFGPVSTNGADDAADPLRASDGSPIGIGLPLARRLVESMRGRLAIARRGPGPCVEIVLERADPAGH